MKYIGGKKKKKWWIDGEIWTIENTHTQNTEIKNKKKNEKMKKQTATMPTNVAGMGALAGGVSGVPATAVPGGLQSASMASIELGKKRMRDSNDDLLMVPRLMHEVHFPFFFFVAEFREIGPNCFRFIFSFFFFIYIYFFLFLSFFFAY